MLWTLRRVIFAAIRTFYCYYSARNSVLQCIYETLLWPLSPSGINATYVSRATVWNLKRYPYWNVPYVAKAPITAVSWTYLECYRRSKTTLVQKKLKPKSTQWVYQVLITYCMRSLWEWHNSWQTSWLVEKRDSAFTSGKYFITHCPSTGDHIPGWWLWSTPVPRRRDCSCWCTTVGSWKFRRTRASLWKP